MTTLNWILISVFGVVLLGVIIFVTSSITAGNIETERCREAGGAFVEGFNEGPVCIDKKYIIDLGVAK